MIYNFDTIPLKLLLRVEQTSDFKLLSDEDLNIEQLEQVWNSILDQFYKDGEQRENIKIISLSKRIEELSAKYEATKLAVFLLNKNRDQDLIDLLKGYNYKLHLNNFKKDLELIERENKSLQMQINQIKRKLPKSKQEENTIDEVIISYSSITNLGFIDTNTITASQFRALEKAVKDKVKRLEDGNKW